ncbi:MAG: DUF2975 domain-containing protein [Clostridia bacterium]|nr:DUF2975 domain-containing protein [Clostridia bacterium]
MNKSVRRIKAIGKVCRILSTVMMVLMIIGTAGLVVSGIVLAVIPQSAISADVTGSADVTVSGDWIDRIPEDQIDNIPEKIEEGSFALRINGDKVKDVERDGDKIVLHAEGDARQFTLRKVGFALLCFALIPGALIAVFVMMRRLMRALETADSPFSDGVVKGMTGFAISLIPYAVLKPLASGLGRGFLLGGEVDFSFGVDLSTAFAALVIILLIMIFKYGAAIQKESDETL